MILAVNVIRDGAADGDELRAGRNGQEPPSRNDDLQQISKTDAGFYANSSGLPIKVENAVQRGTVQKVAIVIQAGVAITSSHAIGQQGRRFGTSQQLR